MISTVITSQSGKIVQCFGVFTLMDLLLKLDFLDHILCLTSTRSNTLPPAQPHVLF